MFPPQLSIASHGAQSASVGCFHHREYAFELLCDFVAKRKHVFNLEAFLRIRANECTQRSLNVRRNFDQAANIVNCVAILEQPNRPCASKAGDIGSQSSGSLVTQISTACPNGDPSTSGIASSKFEFFTVIANEENLRLVMLGDVVPPLKKCKELVTFVESLA